MKSIAHDVAPVMQLSIRFFAASIFFGVWVLWREGRRAFTDGTLPSGLLLGLLFSLEFVLIGESLVYTTAAHSTVFLYTAPIFTALGVQFLPEERLDRIQWLGIAAAFVGIAFALLGPGRGPLADVIVGDFLAVLAGAVWGSANVVLRRARVGSAATTKTVLYQVFPAALLLLAFAAYTGQTTVLPTPAALASLVFQTLFIAIGSYIVWFWLIRHYLTGRLVLLTLLTPLFGVLFGALLLHDRIEPRFAIGAALVLAGILVVNSRRALRAAG